MKVLFEDNITVITPCFCAGADQQKAEIRPASIRGELRWWFRALGAAPEEESDLFGTITGGGKKSQIIVRVPESSSSNNKINLTGNLKFFTSSRNKNENSYIDPGSTFKLTLLLRNGYITDEMNLLLNTFLLFGSIGLRANRSLGALQGKIISLHELKVFSNILRERNIDVYFMEEQNSVKNALDKLEEFIKDFRNKIKPKGENAFGYVKGNKRHSSCFRFRPIKLENGKYLPIVVYTEAAMNNMLEGYRQELKNYFALG